MSQHQEFPRLSELVALLDQRYPPHTAEDWDAVGLVVGRPDRRVGRVMFAMDPVADVIAEAIAWDADLLVTHHPLYLKPVNSVAGSGFKGAAVHDLIESSCGLYVAHTNADVAQRGVATALADALGVLNTEPLAPAAVGDSTGLGRVGELDQPVTLGQFAQRVARQLPATAQGIRVAGDTDAVVQRIAVLGGSGDSFFDAAVASGADVYVTSDLKHHAVSELREQVALGKDSAGDARPFLIDTAHFASEWPWLQLAASDLMSDVSATGATVETRVSTLCTDPWTAHFPSTSADQRPEL